MESTQHIIVIFDIGKTNKKILLFSEKGEVVGEESISFQENKDEDGFPCEDLPSLENWIKEQWEKIASNKSYKVVAVNFATYGASLVHLDETDKPLTPLYNYLKPIPEDVEEEFFLEHGPKENLILETSSPYMGMLNSGLQLYWIKKKRPEVFSRIKTTLHFPQYLSFLLSGRKITDYTSLGCHTALYDFFTRDYHEWVYKENLDELFPPIANQYFNVKDGIKVGIGIHDTSACILTYLHKSSDPFLLLSTGTWCIVLNPFDETSLNVEQMQKDCLQFLTPEGRPVKVSRIFFGREHDFQMERINKHFNQSKDYFKTIEWILSDVEKFNAKAPVKPFIPACMEGSGPFPEKQTQLWNLNQFENFEEAYFNLMKGLVEMLSVSINLADINNASKVYIDGGFSKNKLFVKLLKKKFPLKDFIVSDMQQGTAFGAMIQLDWSNVSSGIPYLRA